METQLRVTGRVSRPAALDVLVAGCVLLAVVSAWSDPLLVVVGRVVPGWVVSCVLLCISSVPMLVLSGPRPSPAEEATRRSRRLRRWLLGIPAAAAALGSALGAVGDLAADYHVLEPRGPGGCLAVVRESSFLFGGGGELYAVRDNGIAGGVAGSWTTDGGYRPIASGTYELSWGDGGGVLLVRGSGADPVWPGLHEVRCG